MRRRNRARRSSAAARRLAITAGEAVDVPCTARRTTSRGWGEWVEGLLRLPGPDGGLADFVADDPSDHALVTRRGAAPVLLEPPLEVTIRPVRYKAEAFHGGEGEIIVCSSPRRVVEMAMPHDEVEAVATRLAELS